MQTVWLISLFSCIPLASCWTIWLLQASLQLLEFLSWLCSLNINPVWPLSIIVKPWCFKFCFCQNDVHLIKKDEKVGASESTLLNMLKISPFSYGLVVQQGAVLTQSTLYSAEGKLCHKNIYNIVCALALCKSYWAVMNKIFIYARPCVYEMTSAFFLTGCRVSVLLSCSGVFLLFKIWKKPAKNCPISLSALTF